MAVSSVYPARVPYFSGFFTGQMTIPPGAGPFAIQVMGGSAAINGTTVLSPYNFASQTATAKAINVGASGAGGVAVTYLQDI